MSKVTRVIEPSDLEDVLEAWQHHLRLGGWRISARIAPASDFIKEDGLIYGDCYFKTLSLDAKIRLINPSDAHLIDDDEDYDMLEVLIHELLHLRVHAATNADKDINGGEEDERLVSMLAISFAQLIPLDQLYPTLEI